MMERMAKDQRNTVQQKRSSKTEGQTVQEHGKISNALWDGSGAGNEGTVCTGEDETGQDLEHGHQKDN